MPTTNKKANKLIAKGKAVRRFDRGLFYIKLVDRAEGYTQPIAVGIDPGSKKEAFTVKSESHTYLNIQADAVTWVKDAINSRRMMRKGRRFRKTPYRQHRANRKINTTSLPPSTRARWEWKLRLCRWLTRYYPIRMFVIEDMAAVTKAGRNYWNKNFSPLEVGKHWFYAELKSIAPLKTLRGYKTKELRDELGLKKSKHKISDKFEAHCVDSWVLANWYTGGHTTLDNTALLYIMPLRFHRRQLHRMQPKKSGIRKPYGGTLSLGFKRGSWVKHPKYGVCYVGGTMGKCLSLHSLQYGKRLTQTAKPEDCQFLTYASWRIRKEKPPRARIVLGGILATPQSLL